MAASKRTARELEQAAATARRPRTSRPPVSTSEALAMLARRGLRPQLTHPTLPLPAHASDDVIDGFVKLLDHYAFRLFLRGAILQPEGFAPEEATGYVSPATARVFAERLVELGLAVRITPTRMRLVRPPASFGATLEWYIGRALGLWLGFDVITGVKFHATGVGGDLDVVAAAEGKLVYLEVKSSPPKHLSDGEVAAFFTRLDVLRPDVALFVVDTALRLGDKVVPMLAEGLVRHGHAASTRRVGRELWAVTPHLYLVNSKPDLLANIGRAIAEGLRSLAPG